LIAAKEGRRHPHVYKSLNVSMLLMSQNKNRY